MNNINSFLRKLWHDQNQTTIFHFIFYAVNYQVVVVEDFIEWLILDKAWTKTTSDGIIEFEKRIPNYFLNSSYFIWITITKANGRWESISISTNDYFSDLDKLKNEFSLEFEMISDPRGESSVFNILGQLDLGGPLIIEQLRTTYIEPGSTVDLRKIGVDVIKIRVNNKYSAHVGIALK